MTALHCIIQIYKQGNQESRANVKAKIYGTLIILMNLNYSYLGVGIKLNDFWSR